MITYTANYHIYMHSNEKCIHTSFTSIIAQAVKQVLRVRDIDCDSICSSGPNVVNNALRQLPRQR